MILKSKVFYYSLVIFILSIILNLGSSVYLYKYSEENGLPVLHDIILDNLPYFNIGYIFDFFAVLTMILFAIYVIHYKKYDKIPFYLFSFSGLIILRSLFIILTPLGSPCPIYSNHFLNSTIFNYGMYPSGHTANTFLFFLLSGGVYKYLILTCSIIVMTTLLLSRGHYSIDIFSGVIFAYTIYSLGRKHE